MENTNVLNEVVENTEDVVAEEVSTKKGLGVAGIIALSVAGAVVTVKLTKKAWVKWVKPAIEKHKAKKAAKTEEVIDVVEDTEA